MKSDKKFKPARKRSDGEWYQEDRKRYKPKHRRTDKWEVRFYGSEND